ncbi:hypothetical protein V7793_05530 [Streptomyces sp. KLMMK]|uniref:hypothetical protein n=1 Tax=Streptomyces sp. KLMMK TaxID=3109353 RepID=UPI002FFDC72E
MPTTPTTTLTKHPEPRRQLQLQPQSQPQPEKPPARREADGMAVASFVLGLVGLLIFNIVLGPLALALAGLALLRGTNRRGRAALGLTLGAADLIVLAALATTDHTLSWSFGP